MWYRPPGEGNRPFTKQLPAPAEAGRFLILYGRIAPAFAAFLGIVTALYFGFGLGKFGGLEYLPRLVVLEAVRDLGPGTSVSAALLALLVWTHPLGADASRSKLAQSAFRVLVVVTAGVPLTIAMVSAFAFLTGYLVYDVPWNAIAASPKVMTLADVLGAGLILFVDVALVGAFCWFAVPEMARRSWSLIGKIAASWAAMMILRSAISLAFEILGFTAVDTKGVTDFDGNV